jgi:hypothetical protein
VSGTCYVVLRALRARGLVRGTPPLKEGGLASGRAARLRGIARTGHTFHVWKFRERRKRRKRDVEEASERAVRQAERIPVQGGPRPTPSQAGSRFDPSQAPWGAENGGSARRAVGELLTDPSGAGRSPAGSSERSEGGDDPSLPIQRSKGSQQGPPAIAGGPCSTLRIGLALARSRFCLRLVGA